MRRSARRAGLALTRPLVRAMRKAKFDGEAAELDVYLPASSARLNGTWRLGVRIEAKKRRRVDSWSTSMQR